MVVFDKSCPGSKAIRNPVPENISCPNCGYEVEIWTDEIKATCPKCKTKVFREAQVSCIDWCPYAKECVGPEVYERLKPGAKEEPAGGTPLDTIRREHDRALETLGLLRGASLCLKLGTIGPQSPLQDRGLTHLEKVMEFFDKDVALHFRHEEEVLFPALNQHLPEDKNPTRLLLQEHEEWWKWVRQLKETAAKLDGNGAEDKDAILCEVQEISGRIEQLLREHIKKENDSLLPIAQHVLSEAELEEIAGKWRG
ncbi:MAG: hemerythrin domain-containing protein [Chloroflexi bacterium]|nr:hemerythrin domain-containing protein [Chloroflexota bacterium]